MIKNPPKKVLLQQSWVWSGTVTDFVASRIEGYSLNVCAGKNPLCSVNLDLDPQAKGVLKGDMRNLPFNNHTFDTVVSDPPWKISYYERHHPFYECVRVCKIGGTIIYNATWIPESTDVELLETWIRQDAPFASASVISIFRKERSNPPYEGRVEFEKALVPLPF